MFLADNEIKKEVQNGSIKISNFDEKRLQQTSYDILLWNKFLVIKWNSSVFIDPVKKIYPDYHEINIKDWEQFILHPWETVLWLSKECFWSNNYLIQLSWKSSLARLWLIVHNTAWLINPWHFLNITFELANLNKVPIILRPWMEIAQLLFSKISNTPTRLYEETWRYKRWEENFKV